MKRFFTRRILVIAALLVLTALAFVSCQKDGSVGIIGGADGPTAIFVSDGNTSYGVNGDGTVTGSSVTVKVTDGGAEYEGEEIEVLEDIPLIKRLYLGGVLQFLGGTTASMPILIAMYLLAALIAYALGSLNCGIIISKLFYKDDIRKYGSGNAGTTNMLRTYGKKAAIGTIVGDALKVVVAVVIANFMVGSILGGGYIAGLFAIIGHVYPVYYGFKGGKGVVTAAITILMLNPSIFLVEVTAFIIIVAIWRYISLGSILCAALYPMITYVAYNGPSIQFIFALLIAVFIIFLHRTNIQRLIDGKENKLSFKGSGKKAKSEDNK